MPHEEREVQHRGPGARQARKLGFEGRSGIAKLLKQNAIPDLFTLANGDAIILKTELSFYAMPSTRAGQTYTP